MSTCEICGEPMPPGEEMFKFHGYSGPCPKPPLFKPYQVRVIAEKKDLDAKLEKLRAFFATPEVGQVEEAEVHRLKQQVEVMQAYSTILGERIAAFKAHARD